MGRTLGPFPKTLRWHEIVVRAGGDSIIAEALLQNLRLTFDSFAKDKNALDAVAFLVAVVVGSRSKAPLRQISSLAGIQIASADPCGLIKTLYQLVPTDHPFRQSAVMTVRSLESRAAKARSLFNDNRWQTWRAYDESAFCDLARTFFAHLNEVVFTATLMEAGLLVEEDIIHRFACEMSVITRAFSARWFNACVRYQTPDLGSINWYLGHCLGKLDLELAREESSWIEPIGKPRRNGGRVNAPQLAL